MTRKTILLLTLALLTGLAAGARERVNFDKGWRFILGDKAEMAMPTYDDEDWRVLDLPHDWAREGDFAAGHPSGAGGGALPGGVGWYRKKFSVESLEYKVFLEFDGVYMNSTVYVNGQEVGHRPYGYSSFEYDITPWVREGVNVVAVRVDNSDQPNSRWYSGCGIYRHVWLTKTSAVHVKHWGVFANASVVKGKGRLDIEVDVEGKGTVENTLIAPDGKTAGRSRGAKSVITVSKPMLWSCETPNIYTVRTEVKVGGKVVDSYETTTGFRDFRFDASTGFWLNGRDFKLNGVCEHHDFGCLGAALHEDALHRKLTKLKAMGVNAIRSSHNPPAPELLAMCDTMGLIVMDESFDMWRRRKTPGDYARFFDEWHERDLTDLILRDRNHPCILMWSIGNEVLEQWSDAAADTLTLEQANLILNAGHDASTLAKDGELSVQSLLTQHLAEIVKRYDTSRPITAGCNEPSPGNHLFKSGAIDIIGFNYHPQWTKDVPVNFPDKPFIFTESCSALQTRGNYMMPSDSIYKAPVEWYLPYYDASYMCSAYDNMKASWGNTHEEMWDAVKNTPYCSGQFIWTGFDYIGEPTPYGFPARSSYFGLIDLAGFPKDSYYMYQSEWTTKPMLHLFPHWNWLEGQTIDLWAYYNEADEVELFVNGKSQGVRKKSLECRVDSDSSVEFRVDSVEFATALDASTNGSAEGTAVANSKLSTLNSTLKGTAVANSKLDTLNSTLITKYHVGWRVTFEPGEVKAVSRKNGKTVCEKTIRTAGAPHHIRLTTDYAGKDLTFVNVEVVDKDGNLCPWADDQIFLSVSGDAEIIATDNGCQTSMERFTSPNRRAFFGKCIAVVRGKGVLTARGIGLGNGHINIE